MYLSLRWKKLFRKFPQWASSMPHWPDSITYLKLIRGERHGVAETDLGALEFTLNLRSVAFPDHQDL